MPVTEVSAEDVVNFFHEKRDYFPKNASWDHILKMERPDMLCVIAAFHGRLDILQWIRRYKSEYPNGGIAPMEYRVYVDAACGGHVHVLEWLDTQTFDAEKGLGPQIRRACLDAIIHGYERMGGYGEQAVEWARRQFKLDSN